MGLDRNSVAGFQVLEIQSGHDAHHRCRRRLVPAKPAHHHRRRAPYRVMDHADRQPKDPALDTIEELQLLLRDVLVARPSMLPAHGVEASPVGPPSQRIRPMGLRYARIALQEPISEIFVVVTTDVSHMDAMDEQISYC